MKKFFTLVIMLLLVVAVTFGIAYGIRGGEVSSVSNGTSVGDFSAGGSSNSGVPSQDESDEGSRIPEKQVYSFLACGDNIMHTSVLFGAVENYAEVNGTSPDYSSMKDADYDFDRIYHNIEDIVASADLSYINQETLVGGGRVGSYPTFCSPDAIGGKVKELGFDIVNLAHNHMFDSYNSDSLVYADNFFRSHGLDTIGYISDEDDSENITVVTVGDVKIAFLAYTESLNGLSPASGETTVPPMLSDTELIRRQVTLAKSMADLVFVSCHWGAEDNSTATDQVFDYNYPRNQQYVELFLELNVDVIIGMHSHVIETCEWRTRADGGRTFIAYSLGNLVSGMYWGRNMLGAMLTLDIVDDNGDIYVENPKLIPTVMHYVKGNKVSSSQSDITGADTGFRKNEIFLLEDYTEELAAAHGCHAKDDASFSSSHRFTLDNLYKRVLNTIPEEFLPESIVAHGYQD